MEIGTLCVKLAGRDAGKKCVVVDVIDKNHVMIDGETRRRKCNLLHLEALDQKLEIKKETSHEEVVDAFKKLGLKPFVSKPKAKTERPKKVRKAKLKKAKKEEKKAKKVAKKEVKAEKKEAKKQTRKEEKAKE